ncbi:MAG: asparagine synthase (glutamine-hydrolyzing) [bacterium]
MCGICGVVYKDGLRTPSKQTLQAINNTISHRGPDDDGVQVFSSAGLAMRRLSIIDLYTGHQPLSNEDQTLTIVFNGEIYNFLVLKQQLQDRGHTFKTSTDTEVIVHGYEEWGENVCKKLNGMFAFAIWDDKRKKLMLARDRIGIKPLYYYEDEEKLVFGSEIKAILPCPDIDKTIDTVALNNFLTFEYIPAPRSIFQKIRKLKPGHWLTWSDNILTNTCYWDFLPRQKSWKEGQARQRMQELMSDSVQLRLISDVPLGAFLSGGIDSSITVATMAHLMDTPVKTFSIGFKESSYNELKYARAVAQKYNTEHHEFTLEADALDLTEKLVKQFDEPFGDFSIFPTYLVSKIAREFVKVTLSGDGGDELFAGYDTYRAHVFAQKFYKWLPGKPLFNFLAEKISPTEKKKGLINSYKRFIRGTWLPERLYHVRWMVFLQQQERAKLLSKDILDSIADTHPYDFIYQYAEQLDENTDDITRTGYIDLKTYLVDNILVKVDRMSMATSLETRVPFLDHRLVEFAFSLPPRLKMKFFKTKYILNKTFWHDLPKEVQNRDKQGFSIPIKNWIREELKPMMTDYLDETRIGQQGFFNPEFVGRLRDEHLQGKENHSHILWALMFFQQWYDLYAK